MSEYINRSKHPAMTAAVEAHFGSSAKRATPGEASGKGMPMGGTGDWNGTPMPFPDEGGFNYTPPGKAGHSI
jgi:hypothetical protein